MVVKKFKTRGSTDDELVEECMDEVKCDNCGISWTTPAKGKRIDPPDDTVAIVIDVVSEKGRIRIYEKENDVHPLDGVGIEWTGDMVMVPWNKNWWFRASGALPVGYITGRISAG